jgi:hypothetical protein
MGAVMEATAVGMVDTASNIPRPVTLRVDTAPFVLAVGAATVLSGLDVATRVMQGAHITKLAAVIGEAGEVTDIRTMDIPAIVWAITDWATAIRITVTAPVGTMIHITDTTLGDIILTATDTGLP